ncbi:MAG: T9SS type A sorting domain-containing protein [Chitinophagaceae bacterium]|nr:T9SS type A sorting domain-containing protein [Chitinophagaceae bacterium]
MPVKFLAAICFYVFWHVAVTAQVIVTVAGSGMGGYSGDGGPATNATMEDPVSLAFDKEGNFYFSDDAISRIRKVTPAGIITTVAGNGSSGFCCDGFPATLAQIDAGGGIAVDKWNNIYYADGGDHRVRKITPDGIIRTIAGTGVAGYNGDGIPATDAQLKIPENIAVDDTGNVYIGDRGNIRIRKINTAGIITTIAGTGAVGLAPDGAKADTSEINGTSCLFVDSAGNVFFSDNNRIRKITRGNGLLSTLVGNGTMGYSGDGGPATSASISTSKFTIDSIGNLYLSEVAPERIRKVSTAGIITTVAGTGAGGLENDGAPVLLARLHTPYGIAFSPAGELHFADKSSARIRKITPNWDAASDMRVSESDLELFPNPARGNVMVVVKGVVAEVPVIITDAKGTVVSEQQVRGNTRTRIDLSNCPAGIYTVRVITAEGTITKELLIK